MERPKEFELSIKEALDEEASQGICTKWKKKININGQQRYIWIKAGSYMWGGYYHDSLGEVIASQLAKDLGISDVVQYYPCILNFKDNAGKKRRTIGCYSYDFTEQDEEVINIDDLFKEYLGRIDHFELIDMVSKATGISNIKFREYLDRVILLDAIILNQDRRLGNIAIIRNRKTEKYRICPIFDSGRCMGLINNAYLDSQVYTDDFVSSIQSKPFKVMHDEQLFSTSYYINEEGEAELKEMSGRSINRTIGYINKLYEILGCGIDPRWTTEKCNKVAKERIIVDEPIQLKERNWMISLLKRRREIVIDRVPSTYVLNY